MSVTLLICDSCGSLRSGLLVALLGILLESPRIPCTVWAPELVQAAYKVVSGGLAGHLLDYFGRVLHKHVVSSVTYQEACRSSFWNKSLKFGFFLMHNMVQAQ